LLAKIARNGKPNVPKTPKRCCENWTSTSEIGRLDKMQDMVLQEKEEEEEDIMRS